MVSRASLRQGLAHVRRADRATYDEFMLLRDDDRRRILLFASMLVRLNPGE